MKNKKLISIGTIDKYIFYPSAGGIFKFILRILLTIEDLTLLPKHSLILSLDSSLGMCLSVILLLIYKKKNKEEIFGSNNKNSKKNIKFELVYTNEYENISYNKFQYIFFSSILDFIITILICEFCLKIELNMWFFDILFIYLLSFLLFHIKIYRHQIISILIIIIAGIILDIMSNNYEFSYDTIIPLIIKFICEIFLSFIVILNKYTMEKKFCPAYELCFYQGLFTFIFYAIFSIFTTIFDFFDNYKRYFNDINKDNKTKEILMVILIMILNFIYNIFIFATIEKTTSFHIMIVIIIGELAPYIKKLFTSETSKMINIIFIIDLCFIFFITLIFNEIIILNFCGMQKNTKKFISYRAEEENLDEKMYTNDGDNGNKNDEEFSQQNDSFSTEEMYSLPNEKNILND